TSHAFDAGEPARPSGATSSRTPLLAAAAGPALTASGQFAPDASQGRPDIPSPTARVATAADVAQRSAPASRIVVRPSPRNVASVNTETAALPPTIVADVACSSAKAASAADDSEVAGVSRTGRRSNAASADIAAA